MKSLYIFWILAIATVFCCNANSWRQNEIEHNFKLLEKTPTDTALLKKTGYLLLNVADFNRAQKIGNQLLKQGEKLSNGNQATLHGHIITGQSEMRLGKSFEAFSHLEKARIIADNKHDHDALCSVYNGLAIYYGQIKGDHKSSINAYTRALAEADTAKNKAKQAMVLYNIAGLWLWDGSAQEVKYAQRAYELAKNMNDQELQFHCAVILSGFGVTADNKEEAVKWLNIAKNIQTANSFTHLQTYLNTAYANYYAMIGDNKEAIKEYEKALADMKNLEPPMKSNVCYQYGNYLRGIGEPARALGVLKLGLEKTDEYQIAVDSCRLLHAMALCSHDIGDSASAYNYLEQLREIEERRKTQADDISYQENRIKNDIRLNELQIEQQKAQLLKKERNLIIVIAIALILGIALTLTIISYRKQRRLFRTIVNQNTKNIERERVLRNSLNASESEESEPDIIYQKLADRFTLLMIEQKLYSDPNLSIVYVAEVMGTNRTYLSKAINSIIKKSFSDIISEYRVRHAIAMLSECSNQMPIKDIYTESGFNSRTAFYTAFKNETGMSPTEYRRQLTSNK